MKDNLLLLVEPCEKFRVQKRYESILLRTWILYTKFTLSPLVTLKKVTSESTLQLVLYQKDMPYKGDEWVTSEMK